MNSLLVGWEAEYDDGTVMSEREGALYQHLDRHRLTKFSIVAPGEVLFSLFCVDGRTGHNLVYRRRTTMASGEGRVVWFVAGFVPQGPVFAFQPETENLLKSDGFSDGPLAPVVPTKYEHWIPNHGTDARLLHQKIQLPSGYMLGV